MLFYVGVVRRVTANDSDVSDGDTLTGSQVVRVYGENLTAPFVTLTFGDVEYTPLAKGEGYIEFILGDNGTATISVDGSRFMSFEVEGIVVPEEAPFDFVMSQYLDSNNRINRVAVSKLNCLNYPYLYNEDYPYFRMQMGQASNPFTDVDTSHYEFVNCSVEVSSTSGGIAVLFMATVNITEEIAYIKYKGLIVAVFNYTTE